VFISTNKDKAFLYNEGKIPLDIASPWNGIREYSLECSEPHKSKLRTLIERYDIKLNEGVTGVIANEAVKKCVPDDVGGFSISTHIFQQKTSESGVLS
jgi:hypothetical protein